MIGSYYDKKETPLVKERDVYKTQVVSRNDMAMPQLSDSTSVMVDLVEDGADLAKGRRFRVDLQDYISKYSFQT